MVFGYFYGPANVLFESVFIFYDVPELLLFSHLWGVASLCHSVGVPW